MSFRSTNGVGRMLVAPCSKGVDRCTVAFLSLSHETRCVRSIRTRFNPRGGAHHDEDRVERGHSEWREWKTIDQLPWCVRGGRLTMFRPDYPYIRQRPIRGLFVEKRIVVGRPSIVETRDPPCTLYVRDTSLAAIAKPWKGSSILYEFDRSS